MRKRSPILLSCFLLLASCFFNGCAKKKFEIGHENPDEEIKKCVALSQKKAFQEAVECLEIFKSRFPQTPQGQEAELKIADSHYQEKQYLLAADNYQAFVKLHPTHGQVDYALFRTGLCYLYESPKSIDRDQQYLYKAAEHFETALQVAPQSTYRQAILDELGFAQEKLAKRLFYVGRFYYRTGEYIAAAPRFKELIDSYPHSKLVPKSLYYSAMANLELGKQENARLSVENLVQNYPKSRWTNKAQEKYLKVAMKK